MKTVAILLDELEQGKLTSQELVGDCLAAIESQNERLNVFTRVYAEEARQSAEESDARRRAGNPKSRWDGFPVAIKDNMSYADHITSAGSAMLQHYTAPYDATVVDRLREAGAIILGHTNMDEFAMGSSGESSAFGKTCNPLDPTRVPGGSSSGAAAAVASGMVPLALGSDTGGSVRQPAAFCGVVGLKPTYGAVSRYGLLAMASSLDQIGPLAETVSGVQAAYDLIRGFDPKDSTSIAEPEIVPTKASYRIGIPKQFMGEALDPRIRAALEATVARLEAAGHTIVRDIDIPLLEESVAIYYLIMPAEVSANLARYDGIRFGVHSKSVSEARSQGFGSEVKRRIMLGTFALSTGYADQYYKRAQAVRAALTKSLYEVLADVDLLLGPVAPELPFVFGEKSKDPLAMYLSDMYTIPVNLAGLPGLSLPTAWVSEGEVTLPISMQLIGKPWSEAQLFAVGESIHKPKGGSHA